MKETKASKSDHAGPASCRRRQRQIIGERYVADRSELSVAVDQHTLTVSSAGRYVAEPGEESTRVIAVRADPDRGRLRCDGGIADVDIVVACRQIGAGDADGDIAAAGGVVRQRDASNGRVQNAGGVGDQSERTNGGVVITAVVDECRTSQTDASYTDHGASARPRTHQSVS